jgi:hypothetical protein
VKTTVKKVFIFQVHTAKLRQKIYLMPDTPKQDETAPLVHWTYSREEWRTFMRWKKMNKGIFHYILHRLLPKRNAGTPSITITGGKVSINDAHQPFRDADRQLQRINIRDAGKMNVMEISRQRNDLPNAGPTEIHIPIPKGRLKEAIGVEEKLNEIRNTNQQD